MSKWTTEIIVVDVCGSRPRETIVRDDDSPDDLIIALLRAEPGMFEYDGYNAYSRRPVLDPIRRKIRFVVELNGKVDE